MNLDLDLQIALDAPELPTLDDVRRWVTATLDGRLDEAELSVRIVDETESAVLNETYRHKQGSTNVLSFPFSAPSGVEIHLLGDIVICAPVVMREAVVQEKPVTAHWAHMVVHGVLHLLGYDHYAEPEAKIMETLETQILAELGYADPYLELEDRT